MKAGLFLLLRGLGSPASAQRMVLCYSLIPSLHFSRYTYMVTTWQHFTTIATKIFSLRSSAGINQRLTVNTGHEYCWIPRKRMEVTCTVKTHSNFHSIKMWTRKKSRMWYPRDWKVTNSEKTHLNVSPSWKWTKQKMSEIMHVVKRISRNWRNSMQRTTTIHFQHASGGSEGSRTLREIQYCLQCTSKNLSTWLKVSQLSCLKV